MASHKKTPISVLEAPKHNPVVILDLGPSRRRRGKRKVTQRKKLTMSWVKRDRLMREQLKANAERMAKMASS